MVTEDVTDPAGNSMVRPVCGMVMVPPDGSMVSETVSGASRGVFHVTAWSWNPATSVTVVTGAVGSTRSGAAHDAIRKAPTSGAKERKSLRRSIEDRLRFEVRAKMVRLRQPLCLARTRCVTTTCVQGITNLINNGATFFYTRIVSLQGRGLWSRSGGLVVKEVERSCSGRPGNGTE